MIMIESHSNAKGLIERMLWNLLSRWKAVLLFCLLMALLTTGYKHYKDVKSYNNAVENQKQAEETANVPVDEQIEKVLGALPSEDAAAVEYVIQQKEWVNDAKDYYNNSILLNTDPTNQRTLILDYYLSSDDSSETVLTSLAYAYSAYCNSKKISDGLRKEISPDIDNKYISELITAPNSGNYINSSDDGDVVLEVMVVLPESADSAAVESVITNEFTEYSKELKKSIGSHKISLLRTNEARLYNSAAVGNKNSLAANIYSIENTYIKNIEAALSSEQKTAVDAIMAIKKTAKEAEDIKSSVTEEDNSEKELKKPGFSKRFMVLGFIFGAIIYVGAYLLLVFFRGRVMSTEMMTTYTGSRVLGEIYYPDKSGGLKRLLQSGIVDKIRYGNKGNVESQKARAISNIQSICEHNGNNSITLFSMAPENETSSSIIKDIISGIKEKGISVDFIEAYGDFDEKSLLQVKNSVMVVGSDSKFTEVWNLTELGRSYDIKQLGHLYISKQ